MGTDIALWRAATSRSVAIRTADSLMSTSATAAPSAANACAAARPIPEPAPVTSATLFSRDKFIDRFLLHLMCCLRVLLRLVLFFDLSSAVAFPERPCRPHFRCTHRGSALAERANLLPNYP